jgi:hypothetical protein
MFKYPLNTRRYLLREASLAAATGPGKRDEPRGRKAFSNQSKIALASNKTAEGDW